VSSAGKGATGGTHGMSTAGNGGAGAVAGVGDLGGAAGAAGETTGAAGTELGGSSSGGSSSDGGSGGVVAGSGGVASGGMSGGGGAATCTADLQNDLNNCGACGKVCAGDQCTHGHCAKALAKGLNGATGIQVDDTYAYFGTYADGQIYRVPLAGGAPEAIVKTGVGTRTEQILLVGNELFWTTNADQMVLKAPKTGTAATTVSDTEHLPYGIASNGTDVFWTNHYQLTNTIGHALVSGAATTNPIIGSPSVIYPSYVAADATYVYWGNAGTSGTDATVFRAKLDGSQPVAIAKNLGPVYGIAIDSTNVYFTTDTGHQIAYVPKTSDGSIAPTQLGDSNDVTPFAIAVDGNDIYWIDQSMAVLRHRAKNGTAPETIAALKLTKIDQWLGNVTYFTVDATHIYWGDTGTQSQHGAIVSLSR